MKKLLFIPSILFSFLNYGQSLDSMKFTSKTTLIKTQDQIRENIFSEFSKKNKSIKSYPPVICKPIEYPTLFHPNTLESQTILNPHQAKSLQEMIFLGTLKKRPLQWKF
jgi:hypothetical protein